MSIAPTPSGLPTVVAGALPPGTITTAGQLARAAGFVDASAMHAAVRQGDAPALPYAHRVGGSAVYDSGLASAWLADFARWQQGQAERDAARRQREAAEREAQRQAIQANRELEMQRSREQQAHFRSCEADRQRESEAEAAKLASRQPIYIRGVGS